jgi:hypothetical protein
VDATPDITKTFERILQQLPNGAPWPFRIKRNLRSLPPELAAQLERYSAAQERSQLAKRIERQRLNGKEWELIPDAVPEPIAAELIDSRLFYENSLKLLEKLAEQWDEAGDDLDEIAQIRLKVEEIENQQANALERIRELTEQANEHRNELEFQRSAPLKLLVEVSLSDHDRMEVLLAQRAWDEGLPFVATRLTGSSSNGVHRSKAWSFALGQITGFGWQLHTWSASDKVATPLFRRPL